MSNIDLLLPTSFFTYKYNCAAYPGSDSSVQNEANCQQFAYDVLKYFGYEIGDLRSDELWNDTIYTKKSETLQPLDLILVNKEDDPYGAHVGICIAEDKILHLTKKIGYPIVQSLSDLQTEPRYKYLVGIKSPIKKVS